jgi:outer membrane protein assembly factor BamB
VALKPVCSTLACCLFIAWTSAAFADDWPQFRGPARDGTSKETGLLRRWPAGGPKVLWTVPVGQGYAGAAIVAGRVYHHDYNEKTSERSVIARSLADGKMIWQFKESRVIRPNHSITRTVPAVDGRFVFSLDPKLGFHCLDAKTGKQLWAKNLVADYRRRSAW